MVSVDNSVGKLTKKKMKDLYCLLPIGLLLAASSLFLLSDKTIAISKAIESHEIISGRSSSGSAPLKIFVMVGQSNTDGHGYIDRTNETDGSFLNGTLDWMVETYPDIYGKLKTYDENGDSTWTERSDVTITYNDQYVENIRPQSNRHGPLVAGYGFSSKEMGPELGFGWAVGDALTQDYGSINHNFDDGEALSEPNILLLKCSWGGRSLAYDYRPPSSGGTTGLFYEAMLANVYMTLSNLPKLVPGYTLDRGYEIAGFAWHQGWNDGCNSNYTGEYESNLANLIRDVRVDLGIPDLPVSIGVSGMNGWHPSDPIRTQIAEAQLAVADPNKYPEFAGTVATVETRDFFREVSESPGDQIYHWNNNCESYWLIGQAMGEAMVKMILNKESSEQGDMNDRENLQSGRDESMLRGGHDFDGIAVE